MKSRWLSAAFLAVALAVSACGGAEETGQLAQGREGDVHALLLNCDEGGQCPTGYSCDPGWVCRRGVGLTAQSSRGTPDSSSLGGTCQENCAIHCGELYPDEPDLSNTCTTSCIIEACGGADYPVSCGGMSDGEAYVSCDNGTTCTGSVAECADQGRPADAAVNPTAQGVPVHPSWAIVYCCDGTECRSPISAGACVSFCESHDGTC